MKTILVVEDRDTDFKYTQYMLQSHYDEIEILHAYDGEQALEILESGRNIDLILLDIMMPRMDGLTFLEKYSQDNTREVPVVVMLTSSDHDEDQSEALSYKCVKDYFIKPIRVDGAAKLSSYVE